MRLLDVLDFEVVITINLARIRASAGRRVEFVCNVEFAKSHARCKGKIESLRTMRFCRYRDAWMLL